MADSRIVTATLVVGFGGQSDASSDGLVVEVDTRENGLNQGRSSFAPGEDVFLLAYKADNVVITSVLSSAGSVEPYPSQSPQVIRLTEDIQFVRDLEANLPKPMKLSAGFTQTWLGYSLGNVTPRTQMIVSIPPQSSADFVGISRVNYDTEAHVYRLTNTMLAFDAYSISVLFVGVAT